MNIPAAVAHPRSHVDPDRMTSQVCGSDERDRATPVAIHDDPGRGASGAAVRNLASRPKRSPSADVA